MELDILSLSIWECSLVCSHLTCVCRCRAHVCVCVCDSCSPMVQCSPVQPWWQSHLPSRQIPWSMQRGWQSLCSHSAPVQPSSHWHMPLMQEPWGPQSTTQTSVTQDETGETWGFSVWREKKNSFTVLALHKWIFYSIKTRFWFLHVNQTKLFFNTFKHNLYSIYSISIMNLYSSFLLGHCLIRLIFLAICLASL